MPPRARRWPRNANSRGRRPGPADQGLAPLTIHDLDDLDRAIIGQLQDNGRRSNVAIARALRVTETTVRHRIERLISQGFIRITAVIDHRKTAYRVDVVILAEADRDRFLEVAERIARYPNVVYTGLTAGRYDLLIEALFESDEELLDFLTRKLGRSTGIRRSEVYHVLRTVKINYDWKVPLNHRRRASVPAATREWRNREEVKQ
jgi:Lrp/AsnC family transcriptional regulator for asnA, asnC and gidA